MSLCVLSVAYPFSPVSPDTAGGAEQILAALDHALTARGHNSLVVACEGSRTAGRLYPVASQPSTGAISSEDRLWARKRTQAAIDRALAEHSVDLIHLHGLDFPDYQLPPHLPVLATLHLPIPWYRASHGESLLRHTHPRLHLCCVSHTQRATCPPSLTNLSVIENGVRPEPPASAPKEDFVLILGRICPEKNTHAALVAATLAGISAIVAGTVFPYPEHLAYFDQQVRPLLGPQAPGVSHTFVGPVGPARRTELLQRARCLLHPTLAPETSSLVAMESLAAGTPVIAFPSGALPEIIRHNQTGLLVESAEAMAAAIPLAARISSERCRHEAATRFSQARMIDQYLELYRHLLHPQKQARHA